MLREILEAKNKWQVVKCKKGPNKGKTSLIWEVDEMTYIEIGRGGDTWADVSWYAYGGGSGNDSLQFNKKALSKYRDYIQKEFGETTYDYDDAEETFEIYDEVPEIPLKQLMKLDILDDGDWGKYTDD